MGRLRQLDGLRGIAILLVVFAHAWNGVSPAYRQLVPGTGAFSGGGFFGVQLFFVLSGFLITSLLLREWDRRGAISLRRFYGRRARRLLPALFLVTGAYAAYALLAREGGERTEALGSVVRALTYTENADFLIGWLPTDGWLGHTWSLAVEEQFYIVWPVLLILAARHGRRAVAGLAAFGIGATVLVRFAAETRGIGTYELMHWDALMAGCLLAAHPIRLPRPVGWAAFLLLAATALYLPWTGPWVSTLSVLVCAAALVYALDARWLTSRVLVYFGSISYGLYLWHALLLRFSWPVIPTVLLGIGIAHVSFRLIETPFLRRPGDATGSVGGFEGGTAAPAAPAPAGRRGLPRTPAAEEPSRVFPLPVASVTEGPAGSTAR